MDIRNSSGQAVNPAAIQDEDLKLYALQALSQQDPAQAVPLLETDHPRREQLAQAARAGAVRARADVGPARAASSSPTRPRTTPSRGAVEGDPVSGRPRRQREPRRCSRRSTRAAPTSSVKKRVLQAWMVAGRARPDSDRRDRREGPRAARGRHPAARRDGRARRALEALRAGDGQGRQEAHPPGHVRGRERRAADRAGEERVRPGAAAHGDPEPRA